MIRLVLDTNVLASANLNDQGQEAVIVCLALNKKVQLSVSAPILEEYQRALLYPRAEIRSKGSGCVSGRLRGSSVVVAPTKKVSESADDSDNRFPECAEAASAHYLVTGNKRHFPKRWKTTEVVNARELPGLIGASFLK
jgi:uncharacterized protein